MVLEVAVHGRWGIQNTCNPARFMVKSFPETLCEILPYIIQFAVVAPRALISPPTPGSTEPWPQRGTTFPDSLPWHNRQPENVPQQTRTRFLRAQLIHHSMNSANNLATRARALFRLTSLANGNKFVSEKETNVGYDIYKHSHIGSRYCCRIHLGIIDQKSVCSTQFTVSLVRT